MHPRRIIILVLVTTVLIALLLSQAGWVIAINRLDDVFVPRHWPLLGMSAAFVILLGAAYLLYRYVLRDVYRVGDELTLIRAGKSDAAIQPVRFQPLNRVIQHINQLLHTHHIQQQSELPIWLTQHTFVVFDTETTGLRPSHGDEIISIGAVKIIGGKLQPQLYFNEIVHPGRTIPAESQAIHGITDAHVSGARPIEPVLTDFHTYCSDAILVGHNVSFDMRFLRLKESRAGVVFNTVVLDTLLLASVLGKHLKSHDLNELAGLLGVTLENRHAALGDAIITARLFLILAEMAEQQGIESLDSLQEAMKSSPYAGLSY
ncbi:MAG: 3'-5' exoribonuclease [Bacteroidetes bacterium]|nr:3'-5' exoribonuclease [Bacteroidota bacterium]MCH8524480.1 3'-5' exoribonuclease [Balneolales bacterium]